MSSATAIISGLQSALAELGASSGAAVLLKGLEDMQRRPSGNLVQADLYLSSRALKDKDHPFRNVCPHLPDAGNALPVGNFTICLQLPDQLPVNKLGDPVPALAIIVADNFLQQDDAVMALLQQNLPQYAVALLINFSDDDRIARSILPGFYGKTVEQPAGEEMPGTLSEILDKNINPDWLPALQQRCLLNTLQPFITLAGETIQQETRLLALQKNMSTQQATLVKKEEQQVNINDIASQIKTQLQIWNADTEKAIKAKYEELNKPSTGRYSAHLAKWVNELEDIEKEEIAEKTEKLGTAISKEFTTNFEDKIREEVRSDFSNDFNIILNSADSLAGKANYLLAEKGIIAPDSTPLKTDYSRFPNPEMALKNYIGFNRIYNGEVMKQGATEYFVALREYTGVIMVAAGLLAPLNMIASISDNEALKALSKFIRFATGIITLGMIVYGYFDLRRRIPLRRIEEFDRELKKARENLTTEGKRMFSESSKDWSGSVSQWLRESYNNLSIQLEATLKEYSGRQQKNSGDERVKLERQRQGLDNLSRRITAAERTLNDTQRSYRDALTAVEKVVTAR